MGYYINPPEGTKEEWLENNGLEVMGPAWALLATNFPGLMNHLEGRGVYVCLVDNGPFTAAAVAYSEAEFNAFNHPSDYRPKKWYVVPRRDVIGVCPDVEERLA